MTERATVVIREGAELAQAGAEWIAARVAQAVAERGRCAIALAGGTAPRPAYAALAAPPHRGGVDWARLDVYFGDERAVGPDSPDSNYRAACDALLCRVPLPHVQVHRMEAERADADAAAADYERLLPANLDVLLLGMGPDGHTASLFPGSAALAERRRRVMPVTGPKPPPRRLTITAPVIAAARSVAVFVTGRDKAPMVSRALEGDTDARDVPARLARRGTWFLDAAAASALGTAS